MKKLLLLFLLALPVSAQVTLGGHIVVPSTTDSPLGASNVVMTDANCDITTATGCTVSNGPYVKTLNITGSLTASRNVTVVLSPGRDYTIKNGTSQTLNVGGSTGTSVPILSGTIVTITSSDGVNYGAPASTPTGTPLHIASFDTGGHLTNFTAQTNSTGTDLKLLGNFVAQKLVGQFTGSGTTTNGVDGLQQSVNSCSSVGCSMLMDPGYTGSDEDLSWQFGGQSYITWKTYPYAQSSFVQDHRNGKDLNYSINLANSNGYGSISHSYITRNDTMDHPSSVNTSTTNFGMTMVAISPGSYTEGTETNSANLSISSYYAGKSLSSGIVQSFYSPGTGDRSPFSQYINAFGGVINGDDEGVKGIRNFINDGDNNAPIPTFVVDHVDTSVDATSIGRGIFLQSSYSGLGAGRYAIRSKDVNGLSTDLYNPHCTPLSTGCSYSAVEWAASNVVNVGQTVTSLTGMVEVVSKAGTTGTTQPTWPTTVGATVTDGTAIWTTWGPYFDNSTYKWLPGIYVLTGQKYQDTNGNLETVTTAGLTGSTQPTWNATNGGTTSETTNGGTAVWTNGGVVASPIIVYNTSTPYVNQGPSQFKMIDYYTNTYLPTTAISAYGQVTDNFFVPANNDIPTYAIITRWGSGPYATGYRITDTNGNIETVTNGGGLPGNTQPTWPTTVGNTTSDNQVVWTMSLGPKWKSNTQLPLGYSIIDSNGNIETIIAAGTGAQNVASVGVPASTGTTGSTVPNWSKVKLTSIAGQATPSLSQTIDGSGSTQITWANTGVFNPLKIYWQANTTVPPGFNITDSNGNVQGTVNGGTTGSTAPIWSANSTSLNTSDGTVVWTLGGSNTSFYSPNSSLYGLSTLNVSMQNSQLVPGVACLFGRTRNERIYVTWTSGSPVSGIQQVQFKARMDPNGNVSSIPTDSGDRFWILQGGLCETAGSLQEWNKGLGLSKQTIPVMGAVDHHTIVYEANEVGGAGFTNNYSNGEQFTFTDNHFVSFERVNGEVLVHTADGGAVITNKLLDSIVSSDPTFAHPTPITLNYDGYNLAFYQPNWTANTSIPLGYVISDNHSPQGIQVVQNACVTGTTQPTWTTSGNTTETTGTGCIWKYSGALLTYSSANNGYAVYNVNYNTFKIDNGVEVTRLLDPNHTFNPSIQSDSDRTGIYVGLEYSDFLLQSGDYFESPEHYATQYELQDNVLTTRIPTSRGIGINSAVSGPGAVYGSISGLFYAQNYEPNSSYMNYGGTWNPPIAFNSSGDLSVGLNLPGLEPNGVAIQLGSCPEAPNYNCSNDSSGVYLFKGPGANSFPFSEHLDYYTNTWQVAWGGYTLTYDPFTGLNSYLPIHSRTGVSSLAGLDMQTNAIINVATPVNSGDAVNLGYLTAHFVNSPNFTGTPTVPTPSTGNNSSQIANTSWVDALIGSYLPLSGGTLTGTLTAPNPIFTGSGTVAFGLTLGSSGYPGGQNGYLCIANGGESLSYFCPSGFRINNDGTVTIHSTDDLTVSGNLWAFTNVVNFTNTTTFNSQAIFTGATTVPTLATSTSNTAIASTALVDAKIAAALINTTLTGTPTTPNPSTGDNSTQIANTSWVTAAITSSLSSYAVLSSPTFVGSPRAPTASSGDSSTLLATTAFVANAITGLSSYLPLSGGTLTGTLTAPSPVFTGANTVTAALTLGSAAYPGGENGFLCVQNASETQSFGCPTGFRIRNDGTVNINSTESVSVNGSEWAFNSIVTFYGNTYATTQATSDTSLFVATDQFVKNNLANYALLASPNLTGTPTAPTPSNALDNSTTIPTTAWVNAFVNNAVTSGVGSPTVAAGSGAGTSPTVSISGTNSRGTLSVSTGTEAAIGTLVTVTLSGSATNSYCTVMPASSGTTALTTSLYILTPSSSQWSLNSAAAPTSSTTYTWIYDCR